MNPLEALSLFLFKRVLTQTRSRRILSSETYSKHTEAIKTSSSSWAYQQSTAEHRPTTRRYCALTSATRLQLLRAAFRWPSIPLAGGYDTYAETRCLLKNSFTSAVFGSSTDYNQLLPLTSATSLNLFLCRIVSLQFLSFRDYTKCVRFWFFIKEHNYV